jgi:SAM-dependent methyltransferase
MDADPDDIPVDESYAGYYYDNETSRTLASSVHDYLYENGRRYHGYRDGCLSLCPLPAAVMACKLTCILPAHPFPNDHLSGTNEAVAHHLYLRLLDDKFYLSPIESPKHVIDLGTGTGLWARAIADLFEDATVKGVDLSPQEDEPVQPNLEFEVDDITREWTSSTLYDLVHVRNLFATISDWPNLYSECFRYALTIRANISSR